MVRMLVALSLTVLDVSFYPKLKLSAYNPQLSGGRDKKIPGVWWPASILVLISQFQARKRPHLKNKAGTPGIPANLVLLHPSHRVFLL